MTQRRLLSHRTQRKKCSLDLSNAGEQSCKNQEQTAKMITCGNDHHIWWPLRAEVKQKVGILVMEGWTGQILPESRDAAKDPPLDTQLAERDKTGRTLTGSHSVVVVCYEIKFAICYGNLRWATFFFFFAYLFKWSNQQKTIPLFEHIHGCWREPVCPWN